jgi:PKD repeat protein
MKLERIGTLTLSLALASCRDLLDFEPREPRISVTAAFSAAPVSGTAPLVVQFTDQSVGDVGGWDWHFGDGVIVPGTGPVASLAHTYEEPGTYTVTLHVIACTSAVNCKNSWATKTGLITVTAASVALSAPTPGVPSGQAGPGSSGRRPAP